MIADDQNRPFQPDDYEQLFVLMFLAISNLVQDGDDAYAYANQITELQSSIERRIQSTQNKLVAIPSQTDRKTAGSEKPSGIAQASHSESKTELPPIQFKQIALAPFIAALLHEQTHRDYDSAERYYAKTVKFDSTFQEGVAGLHRARNGHHSQKGNGVLYVFAGIGKGPYKVEQAEMPTSHAMLIADRILSQTGKHTLPPTIAPIKTSRVRVPKNAIRSLRVIVNQEAVGETQTVSDLGQIAIEQNEAKHSQEMARAIVRRIVKKSAIYAGKDALGTQNNSWVDLLVNVGGVLWEASETADTRCWGLLPEKIQVLRVELPVGRHEINLIPIGDSSSGANTASVEIRDGSNSYLYASFPTGKIAGKILVSQK